MPGFAPPCAFDGLALLASASTQALQGVKVAGYESDLLCATPLLQLGLPANGRLACREDLEVQNHDRTIGRGVNGPGLRPVPPESFDQVPGVPNVEGSVAAFAAQVVFPPGRSLTGLP